MEWIPTKLAEGYSATPSDPILAPGGGKALCCRMVRPAWCAWLGGMGLALRAHARCHAAGAGQGCAQHMGYHAVVMWHVSGAW